MSARDAEHVEPSVEDDVPAGHTSDVLRLAQMTDRVRVTERKASKGPLIERLLRGIVHQGVRYAAVRLSRSKGSVTYQLSDGGWESPRHLPLAMLKDMRAQIRRLVERATATCDREEHHWLELTVVGLGRAAFRIHTLERGSLVVISPLPREPSSPSIVDSGHARARDDMFAHGRILLESGQHVEAMQWLEEALVMAESLGDTAEQLRMRLVIGCAQELGGQFLRAESNYKRALRSVEQVYGGHDLQRMTLFRRLEHCATIRGDQSVAQMWQRRADNAWSAFTRDARV